MGAFLWGMRLVMLVGFMGVVGMIFSFTPYFNTKTFEINYFVVGLFYFCLFLFLMGMFSLFLFRIKNRDENEDEARTNAGISFRQGFLLSLMVLGLLVLQSLRILVWWDGLLIVGVVMIAELYYLMK